MVVNLLRPDVVNLTGVCTNANNALFGRRQKTPLYDFGPGTYGSPGILDSNGDQNAIHRGYSQSPAGIEIIRKSNEMAEKASKQLDLEIRMVKF